MPGPSTDFIVPTAYAPFGAVPNSAPVSVTTAVVQMVSGFFANDHATQIRVLRVTDDAGLPIIPDVEVPPKSTYELATALTLFTGLKWGTDGASLYGQLTGWPIV